MKEHPASLVARVGDQHIAVERGYPADPRHRTDPVSPEAGAFESPIRIPKLHQVRKGEGNGRLRDGILHRNFDGVALHAPPAGRNDRFADGRGSVSTAAV